MTHCYEVWNHGIERKPLLLFALANSDYELRAKTGMVIPHFKWFKDLPAVGRKPTFLFALANSDRELRALRVGGRSSFR